MHLLGPHHNTLSGALFGSLDYVTDPPEESTIPMPLGLIPGSGVLFGPLFGDIEAQDQPGSTEHLEEIDINIYFRGTRRTDLIRNYLNENQSVKFNFVYDVEPINPVVKLCFDQVYELSITDGSFIIPTDVLKEGIWKFYVYDKTTKTASQSISFPVYNLEC